MERVGTGPILHVNLCGICAEFRVTRFVEAVGAAGVEDARKSVLFQYMDMESLHN
jgi:hypothetical protein